MKREVLILFILSIHCKASSASNDDYGRRLKSILDTIEKYESQGHITKDEDEDRDLMSTNVKVHDDIQNAEKLIVKKEGGNVISYMCTKDFYATNCKFCSTSDMNAIKVGSCMAKCCKRSHLQNKTSSDENLLNDMMELMKIFGRIKRQMNM